MSSRSYELLVDVSAPGSRPRRSADCSTQRSAFQCLFAFEQVLVRILSEKLLYEVRVIPTDDHPTPSFSAKTEEIFELAGPPDLIDDLKDGLRIDKLQRIVHLDDNN
jgi:hypothetical protein